MKMLVKKKAKKEKGVMERKVKHLFSVIDLKTDEKVAEYRSFTEIPMGYCNERKYKILYRKEFV